MQVGKNRTSFPEGKEKWGIRVLYETKCGRIFLKGLVKPSISKIAGRLLNSSVSIPAINLFVKKNNIKIDEYEPVKYQSFNEFFTRKIKADRRPIDKNKKHLISPCDGKLSVYEIDEQSTFLIKQSRYSVNDLIRNELLAKSFEGGYCLVFRLEPKDYHRYCYLDDGIKGKNLVIPGKLHSVKPICIRNYPVYKQNCREYTNLETMNWGSVIQIEIGALFVGKISNFHEACCFKRGQEKGMFEFGGSTIVILLKKNMAIIDDDIISNSEEGFETVVKMGEKIGHRKE